MGRRLTSSNGNHARAGRVHHITDWDYEDAASVWDEIATVTPSMAGMSYSRLEPEGLQWPCLTPDHPGTPILHRGKFSRGLGRFHRVEFKEPMENPDHEYPFVLNTGRMLQHWHGGTLTRHSVGLDALVPEGFIQINPDDGERLGIATGDMVRLASRRGAVKGRARLTSRVPSGMIFMTFHFAETPANVLTGDAVDPVAKIPEYKVSAVRLERV
jgi:formate dehydrogenase major subunit